MAWSLTGGSSQDTSATRQGQNNSIVYAAAYLNWSSGESFAGYTTSGGVTIGDTRYGFTGPTQVNYVSYSPYYGSLSGSTTVGSASRTYPHDTNGARGAVGCSVDFNGGGGYAPGALSAGAGTQPAVDYNRTPGTPAAGSSVAQVVAGTTIRITSGVAAANANGGPISDYEYQYRTSTDKGVTYSAWTPTTPGSMGTDRIFDLASVTPTTRYQFQTRARCGGDIGAWSAAITKNGWPGAPTFGTGQGAATNYSASGRIDLTWTAPNSDGTITGYNIYRKLSTDASFPTTPTYTTTGTGTSYSATGLTLGATYNFKISARNASLDADIAALGSTVTAAQSSTVTAVAGGPTLAPTIGTSVRSATTSGVIRVNWTKPDEAPGQISQYFVYNAADDALLARLTATPPTDPPNFVDITGLTVGQSYSFYVKAMNDFGQSPASADSVAVFAPGITAAPTSITATPSTTVSERIRVAWTAPSENPGTITSYKVYRVDTGQLVATVNGNTPLYADISSTTVGAANNLVQGTSYQFYVTATNAYGTSPNSANSNSAVAPGTPTQPGTALTLTRVSGALKDIKVDCDASSTDYGMPITNYYIQYATSTDGGNTFSSWSTEAIMTSRSTTYTDIVGGLTYKFRCYAKNSIIYEADGTTPITRLYTEATTYVPAIFRRYTGTAFQSGATMKRYDGTNWVQLTIAKKYDPTNPNADIDGWVNLT
jgi:hypothetical protein